MTLRRAAAVLLLFALAAPAFAQQNPPPREIWPQAASAARDGDVNTAIQKSAELLKTGGSYGIRSYPLYASSAAALARQANKVSQRDASNWAAKMATQLDPKSPAVLFSNADFAAEQNNWGRAIPTALKGFGFALTNYRTSVLSRADLLIVVALAVCLTAAIFAIALFIRYGRSMAHDFREILAKRLRGGSVSVLAFALLFLPIFLWLGPMWLIFYWFIAFFGYAGKAERAAIFLLSLLVAAVPLALEFAAHRAAGVDSPVVMSAISSNEQSYQPEALRRMQELAQIVPDNATLHMLLGNLQAFEGNDQQAAVHYTTSIKYRDSAGAHVNLGNLHFANNEFQAATTEYAKAQALDSKLAVAYYNHSVASGEQYKFDEQASMLAQARKLDSDVVERGTQQSGSKILMYNPPLSEAWALASTIARSGTARSLFGNYSYFDPAVAAMNPVTIGALLTALLAIVIWVKRRRAGYANACIKCGRTFCHRCKSARESATYCTQCIHIYLKRDGVSLETKRNKLEEVTDHHAAMARRNKLFATFLPGSAQMLEGRTTSGVLGMLAFFFFVCVAVLVGRLAPALGPAADVAQLLVRAAAIVVALIIWFLLSLPVYRRRTATA
ncbi:MAG TPA: hypothetical protein VF698_12460 [Thermoanaerobaculia bacterium]